MFLSLVAIVVMMVVSAVQLTDVVMFRIPDMINGAKVVELVGLVVCIEEDGRRFSKAVQIGELDVLDGQVFMNVTKSECRSRVGKNFIICF